MTLLLLSGCSEKAAPAETQAQAPASVQPPPAQLPHTTQPGNLPVNGDRIIAADRTPGEWLSHGRTNGMPAWENLISPEEAEAIKAYVVHETTLGHARGEKRLVRARN